MTAQCALPELLRLMEKDRVAQGIKKHYPGGKDHDQSRHGNRSSGPRGIPLSDQYKYEWTSLQMGSGLKGNPVLEDHIEGTIGDSTAAEIKDRSVRSVAARIKDNPAVIRYAEARALFDYEDDHYDDPVLNFVDGAIRAWGTEFGQPQMEAIQRSVVAEFGAGGGSWEEGFRDYDPEDVEEVFTLEGEVPVEVGQAAWRAFVRGSYDHTQEFLATAPDKFVLFRGLKGEGSGSGELAEKMRERVDEVEKANPALGVYTDAVLAGRPASSWTVDYETASGFAMGFLLRDTKGLVLMARVPKEAVLSTGFSGFGSPQEGEFVLMDFGGNPVTVVPRHQPSKWTATTREGMPSNRMTESDRDLLDSLPWGERSAAARRLDAVSRRDKKVWESKRYVERLTYKNPVGVSSVVWVDPDLTMKELAREQVRDELAEQRANRET